MQSFYHRFRASQTSTLISLLFEYIIFDACPLAMKLDSLFPLQQIVLLSLLLLSQITLIASELEHWCQNGRREQRRRRSNRA